MPNGDAQKQVKSGDEFQLPAAVYNRWQRAAEWVESQRGGNGNGPPSAGALAQITVLVKNTTDTLIDRGGVVGLNTLIIVPTDDRLLTSAVFEAAAPTADNATRRQLAVLAEPANPGSSLAKAYVSGIFPALVNTSDITDGFARVDPGTSDSLVSDPGFGEYRIIWAGSDTGEQWALVTPTDVSVFVVYLTKDGGSNGNRTTVATWTYTVKNAAGTTLATEIAPARARPFGTVTFAATGTRGLATYEDGSLVLLDAYGEFPGTGGCGGGE